MEDSNGMVAVIISFVVGLFILALVIATLAGMWKTFVKAGQPGWACLVPIYNIVVLLQIAKLPIWVIVGFFIPFVNFLTACWVYFNLSKKYGGGIGLTLMFIFLGPVPWLMLGFGSAQYNPNAA